MLIGEQARDPSARRRCFPERKAGAHARGAKKSAEIAGQLGRATRLRRSRRYEENGLSCSVIARGGTNLGVHDSQNPRILAEPQLHQPARRTLLGIQHHPVSRELPQLRARPSARVLHKKESPFRVARAAGKQFFWVPRIYAHDAPGGEMRERVPVLATYSAVQKYIPALCKQLRRTPWRCRRDELSQRSDGRHLFLERPSGKPRNPRLRVVDRGIEKDCALPRNQQAQPRNQVQIESENGQPIAQPVVRDPAESKQLMDIGRQRRIGDIVIKVVGNMKRGRMPEDLRGSLRYMVEGKALRREHLPHLFPSVHPNALDPRHIPGEVLDNARNQGNGRKCDQPHDFPLARDLWADKVRLRSGVSLNRPATKELRSWTGTSSQRRIWPEWMPTDHLPARERNSRNCADAWDSRLAMSRRKACISRKKDTTGNTICRTLGSLTSKTESSHRASINFSRSAPFTVAPSRNCFRILDCGSGTSATTGRPSASPRLIS